MEIKQKPVSVGNKNQHITYTSTPLEDLSGSQREAIDKAALDKLYEKLYGASVSDDPATRVIQYV
ncbi:hypothetical protein A2210_00665 [Candidatus Woesebacteria bacterium RIFOXYA1_FULL_40_18]|uniref:Uncharacterized protein n=1 Tax=Candidatus Woesebacteria bacterium RIFOXYA1_FULL_40_18 TaxID=1802532 RepID=A0A1F8CLG2_9BACT|nr:MAG: hypothetical protein A2210_00665 [Candidatus Woesebacteria bacterium RIFOXYA1_FULL_40_18]